MSETVTLTKSTMSDGITISLQKDDDGYNHIAEATILFNAMIEHLPYRTMAELYRLMKGCMSFEDPAASR